MRPFSPSFFTRVGSGSFQTRMLSTEIRCAPRGRVSGPGEAHPGCVRQVTTVGFVSVDMYLQLPVGVGAYEQALEGRRARAFDPHVHPVQMLDAIERGVLGFRDRKNKGFRQ